MSCRLHNHMDMYDQDIQVNRIFYTHSTLKKEKKLSLEWHKTEPVMSLTVTQPLPSVALVSE